MHHQNKARIPQTMAYPVTFLSFVDPLKSRLLYNVFQNKSLQLERLRHLPPEEFQFFLRVHRMHHQKR